MSGSLDDDEEAEEYKKMLYLQCCWTNCKKTCPKGWVTVLWSDKRGRKGEIFFDETGCGSDGGHTFCCPALYMLPRCGWYGKGDDMCGKGNDLCPSGMGEFASLQMYCSAKQHVQAGCCTTDATSMKVYQTCQWGSYPDCDSDGLSPYFCHSGCPPDRIRVAIDTEVESCSYAKIGGWAFCCKSSFGYKKRNENPKVTAIKDVTRHWANEPTCPNKRSDLDKQLFSRADTGSIDIDDILGDILSRTGSPDILDAAETSWDSLNIKRYLGVGSRWENEGPRASANRIVCNPHSSSAWILVLKERADGGGGGGGGGGGNTKILNCTSECQGGTCRIATGDLKKDITPCLAISLHTYITGYIPVKPPSQALRTFKIDVLVPANPPVNKLPSDHDGLQNTAEFKNPDDCSDTKLKPKGTWNSLRTIDFQTEHPFDKVLLKLFFKWAAVGVLPSGRPATSGAVPLAFFEAIPTLGELDRFRKFWEPIAGNPNFDNANLFDRLFKCLGSYTNDRNFVVTEKLLNVVKGARMQHKNPMAYIDRLEKMRDDPNACLATLRAAIASFDYMNTKTGPNVHGKMTNILADMWSQLVTAQTMWKLAHPDVKADIAVFFRDWLIDWYEMAVVRAKGFLLASIAEMRNIWEHTDDPRADQVLETLSALEEKIPFLHILTDWDYRS
ncbi:hypothetical protein NW765_013081 [Fusarium oxysporum]|nr:hypothetical protein NW765_013081 [Fusarium oxysporum]